MPGLIETNCRLPWTAAAIGLVLLTSLVNTASGQGGAEVNTHAIVVGGNISVGAQRNLDFGDVLPGGTYDIDILSSQSGQWLVTGTPGAEVQLDFLLPSLLFFGPSSMPITFGPTHAGHFIFNVAGFATLFDPANGTTAALRSFFGGALYVWLGGTVLPAISQQPGLYEASVALVASYTGN